MNRHVNQPDKKSSTQVNKIKYFYPYTRLILNFKIVLLQIEVMSSHNDEVFTIRWYLLFFFFFGLTDILNIFIDAPSEEIE